MGLDEGEPTAGEPLATTELDPAETAGVEPLAYSDHTTSIPVVEYRPAPRMGWILALVLAAAGAVAAAMFVLGRSTAPDTGHTEAVPPASTTTAAAVAAPPALAPPVAAAPSAPVAPPTAAPPPTAVVPVQPVPTTSVPPLATPQARIAEPIICSLHYQYPEMQPVDLALTLVDRGIYNNYDEASLVVGLVLKDGCHGI